MSSSSKKIKTDKKDNEASFNVELNDKNSDKKQIFDLNEIFHIDLSYNFDLLKNLLSTIIKNQKLKDEKIIELENQLLDLRIAFNEESNKKSEPTKKVETKPKSPSKEKEETDEVIENPEISENITFDLKPPKYLPKLEVSDKNEPIVNNIIVSKIKNN